MNLVWLVPALPLLGFLLNGTLALTKSRAKGLVSVFGVGSLLAAFGVAVVVVRALAQAHPEAPVVFHYWDWIPVGTLQVSYALQVDALSAVMMLVVTGVGSLIHIFSVGYMHEDEGYARYFAYLNLFVFFMLTLVLGANFPVTFVGWEGVGLCSYLLIGFWFSEKVNADAGKKAFIMNRIGDFGFLVAMFLIWQHTGSLDYSEVFAKAPAALVAGGGTVTAITLFLFLGCTGKSAQIPLYTWLPDAMAGPTPVSALIHAATMVTAGVYLVARSNDRVEAMGHQAGARVLHHLSAGLHVPGRRHGRDGGRHLPPRHPRVLQGAAVPRVGIGDPRDAPRVSRHALARRRAGHAQHGRAAAVLALDGRVDVDRDARHRGRPAVLGILLEGRDPGRRVRARDGAAGVVPVLGLRSPCRAADGVLHDPADAVHVPRSQPHRRARAGAPA
jgi:proton-conducting membrane transporter/NADH-ubiquinone oxidoreductase (complex I) subunit 5